MLDFPDLPCFAESFDTTEYFNVLPKSVLNAHTLCYFQSPLTYNQAEDLLTPLLCINNNCCKKQQLSLLLQNSCHLRPTRSCRRQTATTGCLQPGRAISKCLISVYYKHIYHVMCYKCSVSNGTGNAGCRNYT
jgi:hypothetical protein